MEKERLKRIREGTMSVEDKLNLCETSIKAKCTKCQYEWESNSKMIMVSCPSCGNKVRIREIKNE
jgi:Zn finger protein HypA/HybF involved in hydrogenase expression